MNNLYKGRRILITGGTGSIGSELVRQVLSLQPEVVRIYSRDEAKQFELQQQLAEYSNVRYLLGDIRDKERLRRGMENIDIVFHAAALKHVPACEFNPFESVKTNVIGTQNLIECAMDQDVEKVVAISTDKVANPTNTMGATKLLAERLIAAANYYKGHRRTVFSCVRFGNVMGSRGSVIPLFISQIKKGGPVTVTDPKMTRFMMSIPQAVSLVLEASEVAVGGETFILKMPVLKLGDLVDVLIEEIAPKYGINPSDMPVKYINLRPGEKLDEELMTEEEAARALETDRMFIITPLIKEEFQYPVIKGERYKYPEAVAADIRCYTSAGEKLMNKGQIRDLLYSQGLLYSRQTDKEALKCVKSESAAV